MTVPKIRASDEYVTSFLEVLWNYIEAEDSMKVASPCICSLSGSVASEYVIDLKSAPQAEAPRKVNRSFSQEDQGVSFCDYAVPLRVAACQELSLILSVSWSLEMEPIPFPPKWPQSQVITECLLCVLPMLAGFSGASGECRANIHLLAFAEQQESTGLRFAHWH